MRETLTTREVKIVLGRVSYLKKWVVEIDTRIHTLTAYISCQGSSVIYVQDLTTHLLGDQEQGSEYTEQVRILSLLISEVHE